jgi:hypothetical protein
MIQYALKCDNGHQFESWFQSAAAFDALVKAGHVACVDCGSKAVEKALMAPRVTASRKKADAGAPQTVAGSQAEKEQAIAKLRADVEKNADYVGGKFADEARAMYLGNRPERAIYGEANLKEAKALIDDGIPVAPLPFIPKAKAN